MTSSDPISGAEAAPRLDEALASLRDTDRHAVLLRFFEKKQLKEVGRVLGSSEDAAQKRIARALEKLRTFLVRRGILLSSTALAGVLVENSVNAAPAALSTATFAAVTGNSGTAATFALVQSTIKAMFYAKLKAAALATSCLLMVIGGSIVSPSLCRPRPPRFVAIPLDKLDGKPLANSAGENDWFILPVGNQNYGGVPFQVVTKLQLQGNSHSKDRRYYS